MFEGRPLLSALGRESQGPHWSLKLETLIPNPPELGAELPGEAEDRCLEELLGAQAVEGLLNGCPAHRT